MSTRNNAPNRTAKNTEVNTVTDPGTNPGASAEQDSYLLSPQKAIFYAVAFFFFFCLCDALAKTLQADYSSFQIMASVNAIGITLTHLYAFYRYRGNWRIIYRTQKFKLHIVRMVTSVCTAFTILYAIKHIPLAHLYGLIFTAPFFASFLARVFLKEVISLRRWLIIAFGFCGVLIIIAPSFGAVATSTSAVLGYGAVLLAAFSFSIGSLTSKVIGKEETPVPLVLYPQIAIVALSLAFCIQNYIPVETLMHGITFFAYGVFLCLAIGLNGYTFSKTPSLSLIIPFQYTQMFWAALIGWAFFDETMGLNAVIGAACIIASGLALLFLNMRKEDK